MRGIALLTLCVAAIAAALSNPLSIVGGSVTTIEQYPFMAACLFSSDQVIYEQQCNGTVINSRAVLLAASCVYKDGANKGYKWRVRLGSTWANSGGFVYNVSAIIIHPNYNSTTMANNIAILQSATPFIFQENVSSVPMAGTDYILADNQVLWAAGWGATLAGDSSSEQLRHVQIWPVNQNTCQSYYASVGETITDDMLCSVGDFDQCQGDSGGPLFHNGVVVGITPWTNCKLSPKGYFGITPRVSKFASWIKANA